MIDSPSDDGAAPTEEPERKAPVHVLFDSPAQHVEAWVGHGLVIVPGEDGNHHIYYAARDTKQFAEMFATFQIANRVGKGYEVAYTNSLEWLAEHAAQDAAR